MALFSPPNMEVMELGLPSSPEGRSASVAGAGVLARTRLTTPAAMPVSSTSTAQAVMTHTGLMRRFLAALSGAMPAGRGLSCT